MTNPDRTKILQLVHDLDRGTIDRKRLTLQLATHDTGGVIAYGNDLVRIELFDIEAEAETEQMAIATWQRAAKLRIAEQDLRAAQNDHTQITAARTILRLSQEASWRAAAQDILTQHEAAA